MSNVHHVGWMERVSFPEYDTGEVEAKIDTGAYSGALHVTRLKEVKDKRTGKLLLRFCPLGRGGSLCHSEHYSIRYVRSATGHRVKRYVVNTIVRIKGNDYPIQIGLSDREAMKKPALLGRRFLRENNFIVDVRINQDQDKESELLK